MVLALIDAVERMDVAAGTNVASNGGGPVAAALQQVNARNEIGRLSKLKAEIEGAKDWVQTASKRFSCKTMIPLGKHAFISGQVVHTSEVLCPLQVLDSESMFMWKTADDACTLMDRHIDNLQRAIATTEKLSLKLVDAEEIVKQNQKDTLLSIMSSITPGEDPNVSRVKIDGEDISYISEVEPDHSGRFVPGKREGEALKSWDPVKAAEKAKAVLAKYAAMEADGVDEFADEASHSSTNPRLQPTSATTASVPAAPAKSSASRVEQPMSIAQSTVRADNTAVVATAEAAAAVKRGVRFSDVDQVKEYEKGSRLSSAASASAYDAGAVEEKSQPKPQPLPGSLTAFSGRIVERAAPFVAPPKQLATAPTPAKSTAQESEAPKRVSRFKQQMAAIKGEEIEEE